MITTIIVGWDLDPVFCYHGCKLSWFWISHDVILSRLYEFIWFATLFWMKIEFSLIPHLEYFLFLLSWCLVFLDGRQKSWIPGKWQKHNMHNHAFHALQVFDWSSYLTVLLFLSRGFQRRLLIDTEQEVVDASTRTKGKQVIIGNQNLWRLVCLN